MKNLTIKELEKLFTATATSLELSGYLLKGEITSEQVDGIVSLSERIKKVKIKEDERLTKGVSYIDEDITRRITSINIPGVLDLYNRTRTITNVSFKQANDEERCIAQKRKAGQYELEIPAELTTKGQTIMVREIGRIILAENMSGQEYYEYREAIPMLLEYLFTLNLGSKEKYDNEAIKRILLSVKSTASCLLKTEARFEKYPTLTLQQQREYLGCILNTNTDFSSFEVVLGLREQLEENEKSEERVLTTTSRVLNGEITVKDMTECLGIDTTGFKRMSKVIDSYKK